MRTLFLEPLPSGVEEILERRRSWGADKFDEVWEGVYHAATPLATTGEMAWVREEVRKALEPLARQAGLRTLGRFGIGEWDSDYRVPDGGLHRGPGWDVCTPTAMLVIGVVYPGDETWQKLPFYAAHDVDEVLIVDPSERTVHWLGLTEGTYEPIERSGLIEFGPTELAEQIDWPEISVECGDELGENSG
jgi:hypothetical protein